MKNLFIVDGSIWVTSGGVNPTSTIQVLALYIADSIKKRLACKNRSKPAPDFGRKRQVISVESGR